MEKLTEDQKTWLAILSDSVRQHWKRIDQEIPEQSFLVGGAVRDMLLDIEANDFDFVVVGETRESMEEMGFEPIEASSFPVFHDSEHEEWALARTEEKDGTGYDGFEVFTEDVSLREDLERRDLTMNAMALDVDGRWDPDTDLPTDWRKITPRAMLIDPHNGVRDANNGVLRHVSDAFAEDPLRVLRVARYAARFAVPAGEEAFEHTEDGVNLKSRFATDHFDKYKAGFQVHDKTMDMMRKTAPEINRMSRDRIGSEIVKALEQARCPSRFFEVLRDSGALAVLWQELDLADIVLAGPEEHHMEGSVFDHTMMVLNRMHELCEDQNIDGNDRVRRLLMAIAHDIGKVHIAMHTGGIHSDDPPTAFGGHQQAGARLMERVARDLGLSGEHMEIMEDACEFHMKFHDIPEMGPEELINFLNNFDHPPGDLESDSQRHGISIGKATVWEMLDLAHSDEEGRMKQTMRDPIRGTDLVRYSVETPEFERETFEKIIESVLEAERRVSGYEALRTGACDEHESFDQDDNIQAIMNNCDECKSPGGWVGETITEMKIEEIETVK